MAGFFAALSAAWAAIQPILQVAALVYYAVKALTGGESPTYSDNCRVTQCDPTLPRAIIYGRHKCAGNIIYQRFSDNKKWQYLIVAFCVGPIQGFEDVRVNDIPIYTLEDCSWTPYFGTATQGVDPIVLGGAATVGSLKNIAYLAVTLKVSDQLSDGRPNITAIIHGRKVRFWGGYGWISNRLSPNQADVETDTSGFAAVGSAAISRTHERNWTGDYCLKTVTPGSSAGEGWTTTSVSVTPSVPYTVSVWLCGSGTVQLCLEERTSGDALVGQAASGPITLTSAWTPYYITKDFGSTGTRARLKVITTSAQAVTFYADTLMLHVGNPIFNCFEVLIGAPIQTHVPLWMRGGEDEDVAWTDNPVWCLLDLMRDPVNGAGYPDEMLDLNSALDAAQYCDDLMPDGKPRFGLNVVIDWREPFIDVFNRLRMNFRGYVVLRQGKLAIRVLRPDTSAQSFTVGRDIIRESMQVKLPSVDEEYDVVRCWYTDPNADWSRQYAEYRGREVLNPRVLEIQLYGTTDRARASMLARFYWRFYNECGVVGQFKTSILAADRTPGDVIDITWPKFRTVWNRTPVWAEVLRADDRHNVEITFRKYADIFDDAEGSGETGATPVVLPNPWAAPPDPTNVAVSEVIWVAPDGHWVNGIDVTFTPAAAYYYSHALIQYTTDGGLTWRDAGITTIDRFRIAPLPVRDELGQIITYQVRVKSVNNADGHNLMSPGALSNTIQLTGDIEPPELPSTAPEVYLGIKQLTVVLPEGSPAPDLSKYEWYRSECLAEYDATTQRWKLPADPMWSDWQLLSETGRLRRYIDANVAINKAYRYKVRAIDTSNNASNFTNASSGDIPLQVQELDLHKTVISRIAHVPVRQTILSGRANNEYPWFFFAFGNAVDINLGGQVSPNRCTGGTPFSSGDQSGYPASNAFDASFATAWRSSQTGEEVYLAACIGYEFASPVHIMRIYLTTLGMSSVIIQRSNNGTTWINVKTAIVPRPESGVINQIDLPKSEASKYWRLLANATLPPNEPWYIYQITMHEFTSDRALVFTFADGFDEYGAIDYIASITSDIYGAWRLDSPNSTVELYIERNSLTGEISFGYVANRSTIYDMIEPTNPAINQHWFDLNSMRMKKWNGSTWENVQRLFVAEGTTDANGELVTLWTYYFRGRFVSQWLAITPSSNLTVYHNLGFVPERILLLSKASDGTIALSRYWDYDGGAARGFVITNVTKRSLTIRAPSDNRAVDSSGWGTGTNKSATYVRIICERGW